MLNLIRLEIKKFKLTDTIKGIVIANIILLAIICIMLWDTKIVGDTPFKDFGEILLLIDELIRSIFIIYASTILSKLVIEEFKNKTINLMFTYPIARRKILAAKLFTVSAFTFLCIIFSNIFIVVILNFINKYMQVIPKGLELSVVTNNGGLIIINAVAAAGTALIPLFFGMRKKSTPITIISAVIVVFLGISSEGGKILPQTVVMGLAGILMAYLTIRNIENVDVK